MTLLRYLLLMVLCAVGAGTILMEIALAVDGETTAFTELLLIILGSIITLWIIPDMDKEPTKGDEPNEK